MKIAQELRAGNVIMLGNDPMVVQRAEFSKSGRNASVVKMKLRICSPSRSARTCTRPTKNSTSWCWAQAIHVFLFRRSDVCVHGCGLQASSRWKRTTWARINFLEDGMPCQGCVLRRAPDFGGAAEQWVRDPVHRTRNPTLQERCSNRRKSTTAFSAGAAVRHRRRKIEIDTRTVNTSGASEPVRATPVRVRALAPGLALV